jgi:23S rRNA pseudouridine1911/1915/1917 synthase
MGDTDSGIKVEGEARTVETTVPPGLAGTRLDVYLSSLTDLSRTRVQNLIRDGAALVDDEPEERCSIRLSGGERICFHIPPPVPSSVEPEPLGLDVIYQDKDIAVINKPSGVVVHPTDSLRTGTLVNAMLHHLRDLSGTGGKLRPGIVHRLDRETSGIMVVAKNDEAHRHLARQFKQHVVRKEYLALVHGRSREDAFEVEEPIARHPRNRKRMAMVSGGKEAKTRFEVEARWEQYLLLRAFPLTGRTHQIRVHLGRKHLHIVGDTLYGYRNRGPLRTGLALLCSERGGFFLHARRLTFIHPRTGGTLTYEAPLEPVFREALESLDETLGRE